MKKFMTMWLVAGMIFPYAALAGGIVTNTNQSASFIRKPAQDAVIAPEGTYYNPAGLAFLEDGFHFSLSNQTIFQTRTISSTFPQMNRQKFEGGVFAPAFPTFYGVYKMDQFAFSFGVNPIGGGGSAEFDHGLPSFEQQVSVLPAMLTNEGIPTDEYSMDASFDGTSLNWGLQVNASYRINQMLGVSLGLRYVIAKNTYNGHIRDIMINPTHPFNPNGPGAMVAATTFFETASATLNGMAAGANLLAGGLQGFIDDDLGGVNLTDAINYGLSEEHLNDIMMLIGAAGQDPSGMDVATAQMVLAGAAPTFSANADKMDQNREQVTNKQLETEQTGTGLVPIIGFNINIDDVLNIGFKYEHKASITMTNSTKIDDVDMYPDKAETPNDMPAMMALGVGYKPLPNLTLSAGIHYYFDKDAEYGKSIDGELVTNDKVMDNNFWEAAVGVEYGLTENFFVSTGYLRTQTGVKDIYHSDLSHSLSTNSIGLGAKYLINPNLGVNIGFMHTMYDKQTKSFNEFIDYKETYERVANTFAIGLNMRL